MRDKADSVVVLLRAKPKRACADFLDNFDKGVHARVGVLAWMFGRGRIDNGRGKPRPYKRRDQGVGGFLEEVGCGIGHAGEFPAGHGMSAQEKWALFHGKNFS